MMIGQTVSHYTIVDKIGEGGMGEVYKAHDEKLDRFVALKFLPHSVSRDQEQKARLVLEARATSAIDDINIAQIHDIIELPEGSLCLVMAYYEGETLQAKIKRDRISIKETIDIALQVVRGLAKAHEHGIIHRDIKPANIFITTDGTVKIIDFGLAKAVQGQNLTRSGTSVGTVAYMSPEQARGEDLNASTDLWSIGVTIYEMLTGVLPFRGEYEPAIMYSIINENPPEITSFRQDVPLELQMVVDRSLKKERDKRYQRTNEMLENLQALWKKMDAVTEEDTLGSYLIRYFYFLRRDHNLKLIIGCGAVIIAMLLFLLYKTHLQKSSLTSENRSLAILPIINIGDTTANQYIEGFAQDITGDITQASSSIVLAPQNIPFTARTPKNEGALAAQLGVRYLAEGHIQLNVSSVKMTFMVFDGETNQQLFVEDFKKNRNELFSLKKLIVHKIMEALGLPIDVNTFYRHEPPPDVYDAYLSGLAYANKSQKDASRLAREYYLDAATKDSLFLSSYLEIARTDIEDYRESWDRPETRLGDARLYCTYVLKHDSTNTTATAMLGVYRFRAYRTNTG